MTHQHLSDDELLELFYSGSTETSGCDLCARRLAALEEGRRAGAEALDVRPELLATQREAIYRRIERRSWWPAPVAAALTAASMALLFLTPAPKSVTPQAPAVSDEQLFAEISSAMETTEPRAAAPIHELFEESN